MKNRNFYTIVFLILILIPLLGLILHTIIKDDLILGLTCVLSFFMNIVVLGLTILFNRYWFKSLDELEQESAEYYKKRKSFIKLYEGVSQRALEKFVITEEELKEIKNGNSNRL